MTSDSETIPRIRVKGTEIKEQHEKHEKVCWDTFFLKKEPVLRKE